MILVTGGAGYIGSHVAKLLRLAGEDYVLFDNFEHGHMGALLGAEYIQGDLREAAEVARVFDKHEIEAVMHFAALISVSQSVRDPASYWETNVFGTSNLLKAMHAAGVNKLVLSSTTAIYGEPHYNPVDEDHPRNPINPYGATKLACELLVDSYDKAYGFSSVCMRYFNAAGADPLGELGSDHTPEEALIPVAILSAMGRTPTSRSLEQTTQLQMEPVYAITFM